MTEHRSSLPTTRMDRVEHTDLRAAVSYADR
jgi:hypothetical protein